MFHILASSCVTAACQAHQSASQFGDAFKGAPLLAVAVLVFVASFFLRRGSRSA
jgi:hypothetical protein